MLNYFDYGFWEKFKGIPDDDVNTLCLLKDAIQIEKEQRHDYDYYTSHKMTDSCGQLLPQYDNNRWKYVKNNIEKYGYAQCTEITRGSLENAYDDLNQFIGKLKGEQYAKIMAILDAEEHGKKWLDIEVRIGKAKERFPEHYKSYIEMVEYILNRNYSYWKV